MAVNPSATQSTKVQGKLAGLCYENTVIDRKGRIRKLKPPPPIAKKPVATQPPKLETYFDEPHRLKAATKNLNSSPVTHSADIVDNKQFVIGNNNFVDAVPDQALYNRWLDADRNRRHEHRDPIWKERPSSKTVSNAMDNKSQSPDEYLVAMATKRDVNNQRESSKVILSTKDSRSLYTDNHRNLLTDDPNAIFNARDNKSKYVKNNVVGANFDPNVKEKPLREREREAGPKVAAAEEGRSQVPAGRAVAKDNMQDAGNYKEVLLKNANLNWKPQRVHKHNIKKIDDRVSNRQNQFHRPINNVRDDVSAFVFNRLKADDDTDDDDDDNNRSANCSQRSESPDTLVERILENVDNDGRIIVDFEEPTKGGRLHYLQKSFSDEILERLGDADQTSESFNRGRQSEVGSRESKTLELSKTNHTDSDTTTRSTISTEFVNSSQHSSSPVIPLNTYIIEQEKARNIGLSDSEYWSQSSSLKESNSVSLSSGSGIVLPSRTSRDDAERSPEEIFEEIMESIHDTDADYEEPPFFLKSSSLLIRKGSSSLNRRERPRPDNNSRPRDIDYSVENDWLSFFYSNRFDAHPFSAQPHTQQEPNSSTGIFMNSSLSSSAWIGTKPSSSTLPRASAAKPEVRHGLPEGFYDETSLFEHRENLLSNSDKRVEDKKQLYTKTTPDYSRSLTADRSHHVIKSDSSLRDRIQPLTSKIPNDVERTETHTLGTRYDIQQELGSAGGKTVPLVSTGQAQEIATSSPETGEQFLDVSETKLPATDENASAVDDILAPAVDNEDATDLLFAALDSAFVRNVAQNKVRLEADTSRQLDEEFLTSTAGTLTPEESFSVSDIVKSAESTITCQHHDKKSKHSNESRALDSSTDVQTVPETGERAIHLSSAPSEVLPENVPSCKVEEFSREIVRDQKLNVTRENGSVGKKKYSVPVAFIDDEDASERVFGRLLDTIEECDGVETWKNDNDIKEQSEEESTLNNGDNIDLCNFKGHDCQSDETRQRLGEHPIAVDSVRCIETAVAVSGVEPSGVEEVQKPPKRTVKVLSDEVTSQTVVLKIAWPSGKKRDGSREQKDQPFRELQLRRTIRMTEPEGRCTSRGGAAKRTAIVPALDANQPYDAGIETKSEKLKQAVVGKIGTPEDAAPIASRSDIQVEYENREQSRREEELDSETSVDVTQTDSVKVLIVPVETSYKVPDLKEIVAAVGQTILQDSKRIPASSNIRVTCEATQSKSCAALQDQDITVINDTIIDTTDVQDALPMHPSVEPR